MDGNEDGLARLLGLRESRIVEGLRSCSERRRCSGEACSGGGEHNRTT
jgi:hypothetical protein